MTSAAVVHHTIVVERQFAVPPARVFDAWADTEQRARWHFPGDAGWELTEFSQDFRIGGSEHARFGPKGQANLREDGTFLDIVPNRRIVSAVTVYMDDVRMSMTLYTVEFSADDQGTRLKVIDQSVFLDGRERPEDRRSGVGGVLDKLTVFLSKA